ncbi:hypothetical protein [Planococcus sp. S3-L1]|uniref:DUF7686 domain-containing protein n=1 Tax=Planococcus sp. S3-L1 TaxID=3046200 RepID=UPI0024BAD155|nr:hypothetical protein [Planococcus sp. S3-L1]MDJ0332935.1 hypothetical protein [Planococcus sp. S3-L1]
MGVSMEAEELEDGGYQFTIHGELDVDQGQLLELIAKAERGMAEIYIQKGEFQMASASIRSNMTAY